MTATNGQLVHLVRGHIDEAHQAGRPRPGRPALAKLTGATDHEIRKALAELANQHTNAGGPTGQPVADADESPNVDQANPPTLVDHRPLISNPGEPATMTSSPNSAATTPDAPAPTATAPGGHLVAWTGFVFGSVMSIAANVLHAWLPASHQAPGWSPGLPPQIGAAVWPIGLMLAIEALCRIHWPSSLGWTLARFGGTGTVALGSAVISYGHLRDVLLAWGYGPLAAAVGPLVLDGLMVVCGFALLANTITTADNRSPSRTERTGPTPDA